MGKKFLKKIRIMISSYNKYGNGNHMADKKTNVFQSVFVCFSQVSWIDLEEFGIGKVISFTH